MSWAPPDPPGHDKGPAAVGHKIKAAHQDWTWAGPQGTNIPWHHHHYTGSPPQLAPLTTRRILYVHLKRGNVRAQFHNGQLRVMGSRWKQVAGVPTASLRSTLTDKREDQPSSWAEGQVSIHSVRNEKGPDSWAVVNGLASWTETWRKRLEDQGWGMEAGDGHMRVNTK